MQPLMQRISLQKTCTESLRLYCCQPLWPKSWGEEEEFDQHSSAGPSGVTLFCCCPACLCCITLFTLSSAEHTEAQRPAARCPASRWWNICVCSSVCPSVCHFLDLILCPFLVNTLCHYHVATCKVGVWSKCLPRGGWHLVSEVNWGFRKLVPSEVFGPGNTERKHIFGRIWMCLI